MYYSFFIGPAGSGKSSLVECVSKWLDDHNIDVTTVNLDPGVLTLPYGADVDVRNYVDIEKIILDYNLGPNGALIAATDIVAAKIHDIQKEIQDLGNEIVLVDTPGQMELFTYRSSGPFIVEAFGRKNCMVFFLVDPTLAKNPSDFVSILLLSLSTQFRFNTPQINLLTKIDLISESELERILKWASEPYSLLESLTEETSSIYRELAIQLYYSLENIGLLSELHPVSIKDVTGIEKIYGQISRIFLGGEDSYIRQ
ncbi:MAG: ATP/GTP-binding protein [Candidatus Odinarchaeum yellowstonii]|uniref:ATP/GTP-binding protein n=1 Tax=Odinarchaeota yellowstonii (strain LCB_4) TaxID=1841599 RepID=A0AAF0IBD4_ODILC|nr:MAG: ATP/GTP-binding protein [Candidatus Odinarchaeum yellowstonii]